MSINSIITNHQSPSPSSSSPSSSSSSSPSSSSTQSSTSPPSVSGRTRAHGTAVFGWSRLVCAWGCHMQLSAGIVYAREIRDATPSSPTPPQCSQGFQDSWVPELWCYFRGLLYAQEHLGRQKTAKLHTHETQNQRQAKAKPLRRVLP